MEQRIVLRPLTKTSTSLLDMLQRNLPPIFHRSVAVNVPPVVKLEQGFAPRRKQYLAPLLLSGLRDRATEPGEKRLSIVDVDLYSPGTQYVFGHANPSLGEAVVSLFRLKQEHYGLPPDNRLLEQRVLKETVHELGHMFYLNHCSDFRCVMHSSRNLADTDKKDGVLCPGCQRRLTLVEA